VTKPPGRIKRLRWRIKAVRVGWAKRKETAFYCPRCGWASPPFKLLRPSRWNPLAAARRHEHFGLPQDRATRRRGKAFRERERTARIRQSPPV
jgi:hypothetical protein